MQLLEPLDTDVAAISLVKYLQRHRFTHFACHTRHQKVAPHFVPEKCVTRSV